jgi:hypothetical protein
MTAPDGPSEVDELIRTARAEARAAVLARLRGEFERELLREVEQRLAPPPAPAKRSDERDAEPAGDGVWVFCVAGAGFPGLSDDVPGVVAGRAPREVRADELVAIVGPVPLSEFGEEPLKRNLNDLEWLESVARAHEDVLDAALAAGPIVPMRICTIFRDEDQVRRMLADRHRDFEHALERLHGRAEWGVKVIADRGRIADAVRARLAPAAPSSGGEGGAYLGRKQEGRRLRELLDATLDEAVRESHARLEEWADASELLPPQRPELGAYEGDMVLNGAYLVADDRVAAFEGVVGELSRQYSEAGLSFELTGPWPAFHFVGRLQSIEEPVA